MLSDSIRVYDAAEATDADFLVRFDMGVGLVLGMVLGMFLGMFLGKFWRLFLGVAVGASRDRYGQSS